MFGGDFWKNPEARELQQQVAYLLEERTALAHALARTERDVRSLQNTTNNLPAAPAANILWNGEIGHSVNSWFDSAYVTTGTDKECAHYFSHFRPLAPQLFEKPETADTITITAHGLLTGQEVRFSTDDTLPTGLVAGTSYFVIRLDDDNFQVAASLADADANTPVSITASSGNGTHTVYTFLDETDGRTNLVNSTLKRDSHPNYDARFSDWDALRGQARLSGTMTVDTPLPSNQIEPGNIVYVSMIAALRNRYMELPSTARIFHGIWDNTAGKNDFLAGSIELEGEVAGVPASTTERRYRIFVETDRGYSILSNEVTLAGAPADGSFSTTAYVALSWRPVTGALRVQVWRYTPASGVYHLLEEISSGATNYIDLNTSLATDTGYPEATQSERKAVHYSLTGEAAGLGVDGVTVWSTVRSPIYVPDNYDKSQTTGRQWLRTGLTENADLVIGEITSDGSDTVTAPAAGAGYPTAFEAAYAALFAGLTAKIYDSSGALILTTTVTARVSDTQLQLADTVPAGANRTLRIEQGGFHAVIFDKIHMTFQSNAGWAANPLDVRTLQPVAAPSSGTQGTTGTGGGGGISHCLRIGTPVDTGYGFRPIEALSFGDYVPGEREEKLNLVVKIENALERVRRVRVKAPGGVFEFWATDEHRIRQGKRDEWGTPLKNLRAGDYVFAYFEGRDYQMPILEIGEQVVTDWVYHPFLQGGHYYRGGAYKPSLARRILQFFGIKNQPASGGVYFHNSKPVEIPL